MTTLAIRKAEPADVVQMVDVLRRSITELCVDDHQNRAGPLSAWLANKTVENVRQWIVNPNAIMLAAIEKERVLAVGGANQDGYIMLNYVSPEVRFRGVSKAMMIALEAEAARHGANEYRLESSLTARSFYHSIGYVDDGDPGEKFSLPYFPMRKKLPERKDA